MFKNQIIFKYFFILFFYFLNFNKTFSQNFDTVATLLQGIRNTENTQQRIRLARKADSIFFETIKSSNILTNYPDFLKNYSSYLISDNKKFAIVTWNIFLDDGEYKYFGYIQYQDRDKNLQTVRLVDKSDEINDPQHANLSPQRWFGCLYYQIITEKAGKNTYYTLLGWDGNDLLSNKKIIEVVSIKNDKPVFGYKFNINGRTYKRLIFEYNKQAQMVLQWDDKMKMIVWDHLSPSEPKYQGIYQFYGPDFTYDALAFKRKQWIYIENVIVKNDKPEETPPIVKEK